VVPASGAQDLPLPLPQQRGPDTLPPPQHGPDTPEPPLEARQVPAWPLPGAAVTDGAVGPACPAGGACPGCGPACPPGNRFYASAEYLLWWITGSPLPPLVTSGGSGALGDPNTVVEFGNSTVNGGPYSGARFLAGYWFGPAHLLGFEVGGFFLGSNSRNFNDFAAGDRVLARPFINAGTDNFFEDAQIKSSSNGAVLGGVSINTHTNLWGAEANFRTAWCCDCRHNLDFLLGFRTLTLDDDLNITENVSIVRGPFQGVAFNINDRFKTTNRFLGGQIGAAYEMRRGPWSLEVTGKLGLGATEQFVDILGSTIINNRGTIQSFPLNGVLAQPTNDGRFSRDVVTVVPELGINVGYQLTEHLRTFAGYNVLYWSDVVRPGDQIDRAVNPNQLATSNPSGGPMPSPVPGPQRPAFNFRGSDFWAQGLTVGLEWRY
jgi:hypothetical protein